MSSKVIYFGLIIAVCAAAGCNVGNTAPTGQGKANAPYSNSNNVATSGKPIDPRTGGDRMIPSSTNPSNLSTSNYPSNNASLANKH